MVNSEKKSIKITDVKVAFEKAMSYCSYQERCQQEVRDKLYEWGLWKDAVEDIIVKLIGENFLNEERFARLFAGGKFRIKKWGRVKIVSELNQRHISSYCIQKGLKEIPDEDYIKVLTALIEKKSGEIKDKSEFSKKNKLARFVISKGYEPDIVWDLLKNY